MRIILISGLSGSGKSAALDFLEDSGFPCVDNLPVEMLPDLAEYYRKRQAESLAVCVDIRSRMRFSEVAEPVKRLRAAGHRVDILFLTASDDVLLRRFSETRRSHPLAGADTTLQENLQTERQQMSAIRDIACTADTSDMNIPALRRYLRAWLQLPPAQLHIVISSFGFKYGAPADVDFLFDVRSLPNPYYDPRLRPFSGRDEPVRSFFAGQPAVDGMIGDIAGFMLRRLRAMDGEGRSYVNIGIGCTGGMHRSVYVAEAVTRRLAEDYAVMLRHTQLPENEA